jgi:hypothetical protein
VATTLFLLTAFGGASAVGAGVPGLPPVDNYAHGGGLVCGLLLGFALFGAHPSVCCCAAQLPESLLVSASGGGAAWLAAAPAAGGGGGWAGGWADTSSGRSPLSQLCGVRGGGLRQASNLQLTALGLLVANCTLLAALLLAISPSSGYLADC